MSSSITTPVTASFNGTSQYASSLQQVIARAVSIASLPLQQLQNDQLTTSDKVSAAQSLQSTLNALNTSLQSFSGASGSSLSATVSDSSVLQATAASGALAGTYTVQVTNAGSFSTAMSLDHLPTVTDPTSQSISASSSFTLTIGTTNYTVTPSANNLDALADAINSSGAGVQATIINIGGSSNPDYRLALQNTNFGSDSIQLNDGSNNLLEGLTTGADAVYTVNGEPTGGISSTSSTVTIAPGLTANLVGTGTSTIQVGVSATSVSNAITGFVNAFNAAQAELQKSYGQNAGPLSGDSMIYSTTNALNQLVNYTGSGNIQSLTGLGVEFTQQGTLTFDPTALNAMSSSQLADAESFLGSPTSGGFLQSATNTLNSLLDPTSGLVTGEINSLNQQFKEEGTSISAQQDSVNRLQNALTQQMDAADAQIASLEQQTSFLTQLFNTENANNIAGL